MADKVGESARDFSPLAAPMTASATAVAVDPPNSYLPLGLALRVSGGGAGSLVASDYKTGMAAGGGDWTVHMWVKFAPSENSRGGYLFSLGFDTPGERSITMQWAGTDLEFRLSSDCSQYSYSCRPSLSDHGIGQNNVWYYIAFERYDNQMNLFVGTPLFFAAPGLPGIATPVASVCSSTTTAGDLCTANSGNTFTGLNLCRGSCAADIVAEYVGEALFQGVAGQPKTIPTLA